LYWVQIKIAYLVTGSKERYEFHYCFQMQVLWQQVRPSSIIGNTFTDQATNSTSWPTV